MKVSAIASSGTDLVRYMPGVGLALREILSTEEARHVLANKSGTLVSLVDDPAEAKILSNALGMQLPEAITPQLTAGDILLVGLIPTEPQEHLRFRKIEVFGGESFDDPPPPSEVR